MSLFDALINPGDMTRFDPAVRLKIKEGFQAGVAVAKVLEAKQRFTPAVAKNLAAEAKVAAADFKKMFRG